MALCEAWYSCLVYSVRVHSVFTDIIFYWCTHLWVVEGNGSLAGQHTDCSGNATPTLNYGGHRRWYKQATGNTTTTWSIANRIISTFSWCLLIFRRTPIKPISPNKMPYIFPYWQAGSFIGVADKFGVISSNGLMYQQFARLGLINHVAPILWCRAGWQRLRKIAAVTVVEFSRGKK
ncbi:hypothetical protein M405DRAFT_321729 [Rhizopogon salebrosus TDB-379]|nr:hypothetical protein M405DRAFT_321729 [Rhizopogon salebrosus TDB-379]